MWSPNLLQAYHHIAESWVKKEHAPTWLLQCPHCSHAGGDKNKEAAPEQCLVLASCNREYLVINNHMWFTFSYIAEGPFCKQIPTRSKWAGAKTEAKAPWRNWRRLEGRFGAWFDHMATRLLKSPLELQDCTCPTLKDQFKRNQKTTSFQVPIFKLPFLVAKQAGWTSPLWNPSPKLRVAKESSLWRHAPQIGHARAAFSQL